MAKRRGPVCPAATKITMKGVRGTVVSTTYLACDLPPDPPHEDRHEAHNDKGELLVWWGRGVDFELQAEPDR
jgi:hypothetical protein